MSIKNKIQVRTTLPYRVVPEIITGAYVLFYLQNYVENDMGDNNFINFKLTGFKELVLDEMENICLRELRHSKYESGNYDNLYNLYRAHVDKRYTKLNKILDSSCSLKDKFKELQRYRRRFFFYTRSEYKNGTVYEIEYDTSFICLFYNSTTNQFMWRKIKKFIQAIEYLGREYRGESSSRDSRYFKSFISLKHMNKKFEVDLFNWDSMCIFFKHGDWNGGFGGDRWGRLSKFVKNLDQSNTENLWFNLDRLFNFVHNSGRVLNKFYYEKDLKEALKMHAQTKNPSDLAQYASIDIRKFYNKCRLRYPELYKTDKLLANI